MAAREPASYAEFWPLYLGEHRRAATRCLHVLGTLGAIVLLMLAVVLGHGWLALAAPVFAYGLAWIGHFWIERNRPATFKHPLWSLRADFHMVGLSLAGRLGPELRRHLDQNGDPA